MLYPGWLVAGLVSSLSTFVSGEVIISEIMYNPASSEKLPNDVEWLEIYNTGDKPVDLSGWFLKDEDGRTSGLAKGTTIKAKQAIVLIPSDQTPEDFRAAWGDVPVIIPMEKWTNQGGLSGLSNSPSAKNEILALHNAEGPSGEVDEVNYDDAKPWPSDDPQGHSIYVLPGKHSRAANDKGESWAASKANLNGAFSSKVTEDFDRVEVGSPGFVAEVEIVETGEEPAETGGNEPKDDAETSASEATDSTDPAESE